jgi:hypothetical protein
MMVEYHPAVQRELEEGASHFLNAERTMAR